MLTILVFILVLSILVLIHEFGHFIMARRAGITVEEFGIGLPPRIWGKKKGQTVYSVNVLPFGGFVKLVGEDPEDHRAHQTDSFYVKTIPQRVKVVVAGVAVNFILAVLIFYLTLAATGFEFTLPLLDSHKFRFAAQHNEVLVLATAGETPAKNFGIKPGDVILKADGQSISAIKQLQSIIAQTPDSGKVVVEVRGPDKQVHTYYLEPKNVDGRKIIGVSLGEAARVTYATLPEKILSGFAHSYNILDYSVRLTARFVKNSFATGNFEPLSESVSGPVGIAKMTGEAVSAGWVSTLQFVALLSLNLAFLNVLPIPALDGGRLFFLGIEAVMRRKVYPRIERAAHTVGFALLLGLILLVTWNDILKIIRSQ